MGHIHHHALSPDAQHIAFVWQREGNSDLWVAPADRAGWPRRLTFARPAQASWTDAIPRWSPDGRHLAYAARGDLWLASLDGGLPRRLTDFQHGDSSPVFSRDGSRVYFLSSRGDFHNLCYTTPEGAWPVALTSFEADVSDPRLSPDGSQLAFVYHPQEDLNRSEICLVPATGGEVRHLTGAASVWDSQPRWSTDGTAVAFVSNRSGWRVLYLLDLHTNELRRLADPQADVIDFDRRPNSEQIALSINRQGVADLYLLDVATGELRTLRAANGWHSLPQWSNDGRWLTVEFESPTQPPDIYRVDASTGQATPLTRSTPPALATATMASPEYVLYPSTGNATIPALLFQPPDASANQPCPAVVYPHGGPTDEHSCYWDVLVQWLVVKGYAVLAPNYRGSTGSGLTHQHALHGNWGIVDCDDMLAAADFLAGLDWVNGERLGIYGSSYGSYLALLALARDPRTPRRYKCGVAKYGDSDILTSWAQGDRPGREDLERQMGHPTINRAGYRVGSPVYDVANIEAPLLILHGAADARVHLKQSEQLVEALKGADKVFELVVYEGEGHGFLQPANVRHFYATLGRFLDWYLL